MRKAPQGHINDFRKRNVWWWNNAVFVFLRVIDKCLAIVVVDPLDAYLFFVTFKNSALTGTLRRKKFDEKLGLFEVLMRTEQG
jgi:hypothetical protein